jgi:predicted transglutaminase-like cysteine proteinase
MFGRVAAWSFAAFLVVSPAASGVETGPFGGVPTAVAAAAPDVGGGPDMMTPDQSPDRVESKAGDRLEAAAEAQVEVQTHEQDRARDNSQNKLAALEPAVPFSPSSPSPNLAEPFGLGALPLAGGEILAKWSGVEADIRADEEVLARCRDDAELCPGPAKNFLAIVAEGRGLTGRSRIGVINRAVNLAIAPMSDLAQWGVPDRWSSPLETFTTGRGDCEDYAIAKYVALTAAGIDAHDVKLVILQDLATGQDHAVVAARLDGKWLMLDNRWLRLVEDNDIRDVLPLFVLDAGGVKEFAPTAISGARRTSAPAALGS